MDDINYIKSIGIHWTTKQANKLRYVAGFKSNIQSKLCFCTLATM